MSRARFFEENPRASAWAALDKAENDQRKITPGPIHLGENTFRNKEAIIIGAGVSGLTTAYELLAQKSGMKVTILEAQNRTGGRCLTLRTGDTLTEDENSKLFNSAPGETQMVRFKRPVGDSEPYLNAGPGRIPSSHKRLLSYLKKFGVEVEVYVMNSDSNLVQMEGGPGAKPDEPLAYRRMDHNVRGWLAQLVFENADELVKSVDLSIAESDQEERAEQLKSLMISFGELGAKKKEPDYGKYKPTAGQDGLENGRTRAGYDILPGVDAGRTAVPLELKRLLESEFWNKTSFYQPSDFLWQPTLFQPVGGMDMVQHSFAQQVASLGAMIHLSSPVKTIGWDPARQKFVIEVSQIGTDEIIEYTADYCFCNIALPFLQEILSDNLQSTRKTTNGLEPEFKQGLQAVYKAQCNPPTDHGKYPLACGYIPRFLACTTKVGWQADRYLWQGSPMKLVHHRSCNAKCFSPPTSEVGVVPIYGGISWTSDDIKQIWYPSNSYHDEKGVLTGAYNFKEEAFKCGNDEIKVRLDSARAGAVKFGKKFGEGLTDGVAIAWQNMPYIKGGWAQWHVVDEAVTHFNVLDQGSGVYDEKGKLSDPVFFVIGDQLSSLPGWQEGAIAAALNALSRMARPDLAIPHLRTLPDTRLIVEGV